MPFESPEAAYEAFFTHFNAEDAEAWAEVMSYPHTRVSAGSGTSAFYDTPEDYAARASWDRFKATGWVRTQGIEPVRVHESPDKVHLAGGWTRFNAQDEPIVSNRVTYILTHLDAGWGIQARFGTDSFDEGEDGTPSERAALDVVARHLDAWDAHDLAACAAIAGYPLTEVRVGAVDRYPDPAAYEEALAAQPWSPTADRDVRAYQLGRTGVNIAVTATLEDGRREQAVFLVALRDEGWQIAARSRIAG
jgi:hypothetical protein